MCRCLGKNYPNEKGGFDEASEEFTQNLQIFFGLNVYVSGVKMGCFQKRICYSPNFYPRPPEILHRYICRICDIMKLCTDDDDDISSHEVRLLFANYNHGLRQWPPCARWQSSSSSSCNIASCQSFQPSHFL